MTNAGERAGEIITGVLDVFAVVAASVPVLNTMKIPIAGYSAYVAGVSNAAGSVRPCADRHPHLFPRPHMCGAEDESGGSPKCNIGKTLDYRASTATVDSPR